MSESKFVNNQLIKIRDKLPSEQKESVDNTQRSVDADSSTNGYVNFSESPVAENADLSLNNISGDHRTRKPKRAGSGGNAIANEREWKKAVFKRWDEFKNIRQDILKRLADSKTLIPHETSNAEIKIRELQIASIKIDELFQEVSDIDDSTWNRHNFTSELAAAMRKLDHCRLEYMMAISKIDKKDLGKASGGDAVLDNNRFVHELSSLSFHQCFRLGLGFFMPLIIGILSATVIWGIIYFISVH